MASDELQSRPAVVGKKRPLEARAVEAAAMSNLSEPCGPLADKVYGSVSVYGRRQTNAREAVSDIDALLAENDSMMDGADSEPPATPATAYERAPVAFEADEDDLDDFAQEWLGRGVQKDLPDLI